jgi:hypothetical protein
MYWFPAQCSPDRSVSSAGTAAHATTGHGRTGPETCTRHVYY